MAKFGHFIALAAACSLSLVSAPAFAGGLFGKGGLIRGSVGGWMDKNVEHPILTPVAQGATVAGATALGTYYGGAAGGMAGACAGQNINSMFAGQGGTNCVGPMAQQAANQYGQQVFAQNVPMGSFCATPLGRVGPGQVVPVGTPCNIMTPNGPVFGSIVQ